VQRIAETLGMTRTQVSIIVHSPTFKHEYALRRAIVEEREDKKVGEEEDEVLRTLKAGAVNAANKLVHHIDSIEDTISIRSCEAILDRSGYGKKVERGGDVNIGPTIVIGEKEARRIVESIEIVEAV